MTDKTRLDITVYVDRLPCLGLISDCLGCVDEFIQVTNIVSEATFILLDVIFLTL